MPKRPSWRRDGAWVGKGRDSLHWLGLPSHTWPRTLRGLRILIVPGLPGCYKAAYVKEGGFCDSLLEDSSFK